MRFLVRSIAPHEAVISEASFEAADEASLRLRLEAEGMRILSLRATHAGGRTRRSSLGVDRLDVAGWCRELVTLLRAGMTAVEAIETLQLQTDRPGAATQTRLLAELHQGRPLSEAMQAAGGFPQVLVASVIASERTSRLADALEDYLRYDTQLAALRRQAFSAAVYPAVVVAVGMLISLFLLTFVMPRFARMYASFRGEVSPVTRLMLWFSGVLTHSLPAVIGIIVVLALALRVAYTQGVLARAGTWIVSRIPTLRRARDHFVRAKLFQALMLTLRGGYPLVDALRVCQSLRLGGGLDPLLAGAKAAVERGTPASHAMAGEGLVDNVGERLLRVGERSGQFEQVLQTLADRHAEAFATFVQRATRLVEPLLLLMVAVMVGGIVIMMYMPVFDIASGLR
jgi:general secretion pathway protein F